MDDTLAGKIALVAGATRGAGRQIAVQLGARGATVYLTGRSTRTQRSEMDRPETIDETARNRGMVWHAEMVAFTGRTFRVAARLTKFINEKTGKMIHPKNDVIILENAVCHSRYVDNCRLFCPRRMYLYFREIWLERVPEAASPPGGSSGR